MYLPLAFRTKNSMFFMNPQFSVAGKYFNRGFLLANFSKTVVVLSGLKSSLTRTSNSKLVVCHKAERTAWSM